ncbi:ABC transporter G family member 20-like [Haemaphysalis longicornis]
MVVPRGGIYALLGSSGCGKTTLLRCVMGRKRYQNGTIRVFDMKPGTPGSKIPGSNVGYMPQELALYNSFSIAETLHFYARLFDMSAEACNERADFLIGLLDIPDKTRLVSYLSGGQKRRVSLAISLIHSPPFVILDEPTVGIDPVLRKAIWDHLTNLCDRDKMTCIITTHYIDEARLASTVAFLREGEILAQESPDNLMAQHNTRNLEQVFLELAQQEKAALPPREAEQVDAPGDELQTQLSFMKSVGEKRPALNKKDFGRSKARVGALFKKNVVRLRRNPGLLVYSLLLPAVEVALFCAVIGKVPTGLRLAVVNEEHPSPLSTGPLLSASFLEAMDSSVLPQVSYPSIDEAIESVRSGLTYGVVQAKANLSLSLRSRFTPSVAVNEALLDSASLHVYLDMSNQQVFMTVQYYLAQALAAALPTQGINMLNFQGVLVTCLRFIYFVSATLCVNTLLGEKGEGLLERLLVAGVRPYEVILAHVCSLSFVVVAQDLTLLLVGFVGFGLPARGPIPVICLIAVMQGICGMALGLMASAVLDNAGTAATIIDGLNYPVLIISGVLWPLEGIPQAVRYLSYALPITLPADALRSVMSRGWGITHPNVLRGVAVNTGWSAVFLVACIMLFRQ